ncbi:sulfite exporter TauE/SafE family protein [Rubrobacter indicoceani]|uniref:sulfite exporter TauE/SafE family protein n=1 Tax=Rubrobacter indicoceani TaxID=2051957 RepID=UPI000E5B1911|nr:sulfite exporter TauE/SafE family protein [Rubrobacter indicoceani]
MEIFDLLVLLVFGVVGGMLSGLVGVGGGIVFVPALVYAAGWNITEAVAASLIIIVFSSLSGTIRNQSSRDPANWRWTLLFSLAVAPSSLIGVAISRVSPETVVEAVFGLLLLALAYPTAKGRPEMDEGVQKIPTWTVFAAGIFIGALSGLVGVGGGVVMVPLMVLGLGLTAKRAVSTSLAVVMFTGLVGGLGYILTGFDRISEVPPLVVGSIVGAWLGVKVRDPLPDRVVRVGFACFMVVVAIRTLLGAFGV